MPWCEECAKFWNPNSMTPEGACPTCGKVLEPAKAVGSLKDVKELAGAKARAPWHFKLLVGAIGAYLAWRLVEMVGWLIGKL